MTDQLTLFGPLDSDLRADHLPPVDRSDPFACLPLELNEEGGRLCWAPKVTSGLVECALCGGRVRPGRAWDWHR